MQTNNHGIPLTLRIWSNLSSSLPLRAALPIGPGGSKLDFSVCLATSLTLGFLNAIAQLFLFYYVGFPYGKNLQVVAGSMVGILHSTFVVAGVMYLFSARRYVPCEKMSDAPTWWQNACHAVLQFCTGYMIYDFAAMFLNGNIDSSDYAFLAHHVIVIVMITSARMIGAGHASILACIVIGEVTNPFHNCYFITSTALATDCCKDIGWIQTLHYINTFLFCVLYICVRTIPGWTGFCHMSYHWIRYGKKNGMPVSLMISWAILKWGIAFGSFPWILDCAKMLNEKYFSGVPATASTTTSTTTSTPDL